MSTILVYAPALAHTKRHHPENNKRIASLLPALEDHKVLGDLTMLDPVMATQTQLRRAHTQGLLDYVELVCEQGGGLLDQGDTYATGESYSLARLAAGGCCSAVDAILEGRARNGFALVRPPGHHAETDNVSGFCLINNVAVAALHARANGCKRVLVLDFDVHHGNGTQDIFYEEDDVLFISMHLYTPFFYPGIGGLHEVGTRAGRGYTINVPFPPQVGDMGYMRVMLEYLKPSIARFKPDMMLISAGFDAHWRDPLAMAGLSLTGYGMLAQTLVSLANELCDGRILFVLEGGYELDVLSYGIINVFNALLDRDRIYDPFGPMPTAERDITDLLCRLQERPLPF